MNKLLLFPIILLSLSAAAQDFKYGEITSEEMNMQRYSKDTSAHAVVLNEYGTARIDEASDERMKLFFTYHVKIKIFDDKGFNQGNIEIPYYSDEEHPADMDDIKGVTYYTNDNGLVQHEELSASKVFRVKDNKYWMTLKFAMPALHKGCVIEYTYHLTTPHYYYNFHDWQFQSDIPKMHSAYEVHIPGYWAYNAALRGRLKLDKNTAEVEQGCFSVGGHKADCSHMIYSMSDIPALIEEDYMTSPKNFLSAISFQLEEFVNPYNGVKTKETKEWRDVDYQMKDDPNFGGQLKRRDLMKEKVLPVIAGKTNDLEKAKAIYAYLQKWYKWNDFIGIESPDGIKKAYESHSGTVADINISLIAALNGVGINTEAVVLSTRDHGFVNKLYPVINDFNYIVAKTNIDGNSYFLDASDPLLTFGMLPMKCLNDQGRVFSLDKPSYWVDLTNLTQKENVTYACDLTLKDNGKLKGTINRYSIGYSGYLRRKEIKKFNSTDEYVESFGEKMPKVKILKSTVTGVDSLDNPVAESYEVEMNVYDNMNANKLVFNPFIMNRVSENPFKLAERDYPVDMGMASNERYVLTLRIPAQYTIETPPANVAYALPNQGGKFLTTFDGADNVFTFSNVWQFNKGIYSAEEYPYLKEFYNKVILTEKADIMLKKK